MNEIHQHLARNIAFSVSGAIEQMDLWNVKYEPYAAGGIFGRAGAPWEKVPSL
jgi:S-adenosylmethionine synthetase